MDYEIWLTCWSVLKLYRENIYGVASQMKIWSVEFRMSPGDAICQENFSCAMTQSS